MVPELASKVTPFGNRPFPEGSFLFAAFGSGTTQVTRYAIERENFKIFKNLEKRPHANSVLIFAFLYLKSLARETENGGGN